MEKIKELLLKKEKGLVFLSAPTKGGKTKLVECISADRQTEYKGYVGRRVYGGSYAAADIGRENGFARCA